MDKPKFIANAGLYDMVWEDYGIAIRVSRVRDHTSGDISSEISIQTTLPPSVGHVLWSKFNLASKTARVKTAKDLADQLEGMSLPWNDMMEYLCLKVMEEHRRGEPTVVLTEVEKSEASAFRVHPLLLDKEPNVIYAEGGTGKSMLAALFAALVDTGDACLGLTPEPGNVLYLDWETDVQEIKERMENIYRGLGFPPSSNVMYRYCHQPFATDIEQIQGIVMDNNINFIIVDSLGPACGGEPESAEVMLRFFGAMRTLKISSLTLHHENKGKSMFGSVYVRNYARQVFRMKKSQEPDESTLTMALFNEKANNHKLLKPMGFKLEFGNDAYVFSKTEVQKIEGFIEQMSLRDQIHELLSHETMDAKEIASILGEKEPSIRAILNRHKTHFIHLQDKKWGLMARPEHSVTTT